MFRRDGKKRLGMQTDADPIIARLNKEEQEIRRDVQALQSMATVRLGRRYQARENRSDFN